jgi:hypothetical protein
MAIGIALAALIGGGNDAASGPGAVPAATPLPLDGRSPALPAGADERVLVRLSRPALGELKPVPAGAKARAYVASLHAEGRALRGALRARGLKLGHVVELGRTYPGFAATVPADELARLPSLGVRAEAVRRLYPTTATILPARGTVTAPTPPLPGPNAGVALIDGTPLLAPMLRGIDAGFLRTGRSRPAPVTGRPEVSATTDELIAALERAVDPNRDGDPSDHARVALVGLSSPYAGFGDAPDARAAAAAARLGTLVVAGAGNEDGPVGSPGGGPAVLTAGALPAGGLPLVTTPWGPGALVGGRIPGRAVELVHAAGPKELYDAQGRSRVRGRAVVLRGGARPTRQAELAAGAGAAVLVLADPAGTHPVPGIPDGSGVPATVALAGDAATQALAARGGGVSLASESVQPTLAPPGRAGTGCGAGSSARFSGRGGYDAKKPDVLAPATARTRAGLIAGTGVAAARAARAAAREGGGSDATLLKTFAVKPPAPLRPGDGTVACPGEIPAGPLELRRERGRVDGVTLVLGSVRGTAPVQVRPAARLDLALLGAGGKVDRLLTPPGGARDLLPGEYAYTLPKGALGELSGRHRFRARVEAPGGRARVLVSEAFGG